MEPTEKEIELETTENQFWIEQAQALARLEKNKDFQDVVINGYLMHKALDSVSMLADDGVKLRGERGNVMEDLVAISNLQYHFRMIKNLGTVAEDEEYEQVAPDVE